MLKIQTWFQTHWNDETGASLVEYALLLVLIAIVAILAITAVGTEVNSAFSEIGGSMSTAGS